MVEIKGCVCSNDFEKEKSESYWWTSARIKGEERVVGVDFAVVVNGRAGSNGWLGVTAY